MSRYGENAAKTEAFQDEANWTNNFWRAKVARDYALLRELIEEALEEGYTIPASSDHEIELILHDLKRKY